MEYIKSFIAFVIIIAIMVGLTLPVVISSKERKKLVERNYEITHLEVIALEGQSSEIEGSGIFILGTGGGSVSGNSTPSNNIFIRFIWEDIEGVSRVYENDLTEVKFVFKDDSSTSVSFGNIVKLSDGFKYLNPTITCDKNLIIKPEEPK